MNKPTIVVCGLGQMGASAAVLFARAGYRVTLWGRSSEKVQAVSPQLEAMKRFLDERSGATAVYEHAIQLSDQLKDAVADADFVLECIAEQFAQKVDFFRMLRPMLPEKTIIMTCTSGLSITEMGRASGIGERFVGAHFWNPPHLMPLVEVIAGDETASGLEKRVAELLESVGKIAVTCKDVPGFIGNRLLHALWREALHLVEAGVCSAQDVDRVARLTFALRMPAVGPFENMDLVGLPLLADIQGYLLKDLSCLQSVSPVVSQKLEQGELGMRQGKGFYDWKTRDANETIAARDRQIVQQLDFLEKIGRLA
jgi:3-hydroxybutyryl-CoA dehydrogenase